MHVASPKKNVHQEDAVRQFPPCLPKIPHILAWASGDTKKLKSENVLPFLILKEMNKVLNKARVETKPNAPQIQKIKIDKSKKDKKIHLNFNASNYITEVFVNNNSVGYHEGGFTPFNFNIEHVVDFEKDNTLIVKVIGPITIQDKVIDGIGQMETPQWRGSYTGGIWQDVFLSYTGQTHIKDVFINANHNNGVVKVNT